MGLQSHVTFPIKVAALVRRNEKEIVNAINVPMDLVEGVQCSKIQDKSFFRTLDLIDMVFQRLER